MEEQMKKRVLAFVVVVALLGLLLPAIVFSDTEIVICTVSAYLVSLTIDDGSVAYGVLPFSATGNTTAAGLNQTQTVTNSGTVTEDFAIKSNDAYGSPTKTWDLVTTSPGYNEFKHEFSTTGGSSWTAMPEDNSYTTLVGSVAPAGEISLDLQITMPSSTDDNVEHGITVTVMATESP
jgi:hypothetical protein